MRYAYLSELGHHYQNEDTDPSRSVRVAALTGVEVKLMAAIVDLNNAVKSTGSRRPLPALPKGNSAVAKLVAFHETAQKKAVPSSTISELQAKVKRGKAWLELQGCVLKADGSIDWSLSNRATVVYDHTLAAQGLTKVRINGGRLFLDNGHKEPLDTSKMVTHFSGPGHAIYVMSESGNLHVASHSVGHRHHSSLLAGGNVACAGELKATAGYITWLSNKSGHYFPSISHLLQVLHQLQKSGVSMAFSLDVLPAKEHFPNVGAFLKKLESDGEPDYELMKLMAYSDHLTDDILSTHAPDAWRWRTGGEEAGVYSIGTSQRVDHKIVRQWLKSQNLQKTPAVQAGDSR